MKDDEEFLDVETENRSFGICLKDNWVDKCLKRNDRIQRMLVNSVVVEDNNQNQYRLNPDEFWVFTYVDVDEPDYYLIEESTESIIKHYLRTKYNKDFEIVESEFEDYVEVQ